MTPRAPGRHGAGLKAPVLQVLRLPADEAAAGRKRATAFATAFADTAQVGLHCEVGKKSVIYQNDPAVFDWFLNRSRCE